MGLVFYEKFLTETVAQVMCGGEGWGGGWVRHSWVFLMGGAGDVALSEVRRGLGAPLAWREGGVLLKMRAGNVCIATKNLQTL